MKVYFIFIRCKKHEKGHLYFDNNETIQYPMYPEDEFVSIECKNHIMVLYAYTSEHKLLENFKSSRNMKMFFVKKVHSTRDEFCTIYDRFSHYALFKHDLISGYNDKISLSITNFEYDSITTDPAYLFLNHIQNCHDKNLVRSADMYNLYTMDCSLFKPKLEKSLYDICFSNFGIDEDEAYCCWNGLETNEFNIFLNMFGNTLKGWK